VTDVVQPRMVPEGVNSLYRRFRPGRFSELRGQEHVIRALQGAVAHDRVVHAYLFSGPRGTGKTSTARILAKALNCPNVVDGDPCNACASCVAITQGASLDVVELDAASNNGVEYVRELAASAWIGTAGRHKVYIIDEVHMLTKASSNALLKTLEEPPHGVVFVLATTDPHKVLDTIKSRTQHLEFRLIAPNVLGELLNDVVTRAALSVDGNSVDIAVQRAKGSARDALSALDQIVASGLSSDVRPDFEALFAAFAENDAVAALTQLARLARDGWDPEQLAENLIAELRQAFLLLVAPEVSDLYAGDRERLAAWGHQFGLPKTVRIIEALGKTVREMHSAPDPTVVLEVTVARLTHPELDNEVAALLERVAKLEKQVAQGGSAAPAAPAPRATAPSRPIAGLQRTGSATPQPTPATPAPVKTTVEPVIEEPTVEALAVTPVPVPSDLSALTLRDVVTRIESSVMPTLMRSAQALLRTSEWRSFEGGVLTIALTGSGLRSAAERIEDGLRSALDVEFGTRIQLAWTFDGVAPADLAAPTGSNVRMAEEADVSYEEIDDSPVLTHDFQAHILKEAFPNAEEV
jgi:DNA polymerase III subunit gamma/tau